MTAAALPLGRLALCLDCDCVFDLSAGRCPSCSSRSWHLLARWIGRAA